MNENSKKRDIWEAALREFADVGYDKASTDNICKNAGVSKGLLFHYYGTKKNLYIELINECMDELMAQFDGWECYAGDFAEVMLHFMKIKYEFFRGRSYMYNFLVKGLYQAPNEVKKEMQNKYNEIMGISMDMMMYIVKKMTFRKNVSEEHVVLLLSAVISLFEKKYQPMAISQNLFDSDLYDHVRSDFKALMELLMYGFAERTGGELT